MKNILKILLIFNIFSNTNTVNKYTSCLSNLTFLYNYTNLAMPDNIISNVGITIAMEQLAKNICFGPCYIGYTQNILFKISGLFSKKIKFQYIEIGIYKNIFSDVFIGINAFIFENKTISIKVSLFVRKKIHKITGILTTNYITYCINKPIQKFSKNSKFTNLNIKIKQKNNVLTNLVYFRKSKPNKKNLQKIIRHIYTFNYPTNVITNLTISNKNKSKILINKVIYHKRSCQFDNIVYIINNEVKLKKIHYLKKEIYSYIDSETLTLIFKIFNIPSRHKYFLDVSSKASSTLEFISSQSTSSNDNSNQII